MQPEELSALISNGFIEHLNDSTKCSDLGWNPHPAFEGVYIKHLVPGSKTEGLLSCHMVRIDPGCKLETHTHENQWELHEVIKGDGDALLEEKTMDYHPGRSAVIPKGKTHSVRAGQNGLTLLAKFFPALM
ncbi:Cupin domain-containing protein [Maridesulfovibrio ferrireducens]|uniref:Cupin domain-containing protein n=1 Tax=Maridesulfovibrio ferrireducens TaxID=246191 RepID=A0A1G9FP14_9BACT|nr:cupin domain-containing protein [Maridesulfovibrio ferrireducens]SDK90082.1 Cupin domain-containing protein [Maridesulfovibrio ferrireducens]